MVELELKLSVDEPFKAPELRQADLGPGSLVEELPTLDLRAVYYDTADLRLARQGITLRHRTGEGRPKWTLKLPADASDLSARNELDFEGGRRAVPAEARDLLTAFVRRAALVPVTHLRTRRRRWSFLGSEGRPLAELADDRVSVLERDRVSKRFRELEVEGRELDRPGLARIARVLEAAGATPDATPKALRALGSRASGPPEVVPATGLEAGDPVALYFQSALARSVQRLLSNDPWTRLGENEALHQMRVAARRLRSHLRTFAPFIDEQWARGLAEELRWLGEELGPARDLDVMTARLQAAAKDIEPELGPLFGSLSERRAEARVSMGNALRSPRYVDLLERLVDAARSPRVVEPAWAPAASSMAPRVLNAFRKLVKRGRELGPESSLEEFHRVRILAKRARYAAEAAMDQSERRGRRDLGALAALAADTQDVLGELHDATACATLLTDFVRAHETDGALNLAVGRLLERQERSASEARWRFWKCWPRLERRHRSAFRG